ncbi:sulfurtransferase [Thiobacillus sp. 65-1402]|uniref:sulfurtransferase n=1 Tax=Thiobacillus sp. 65-1402 TaxID=1895861 RepID=UPI0009627352|nr:sulfurtransferase [Thiobacillus sp. 65-1402]OJW90256.1 MAG: sulfurtransferase [Thiobacillus sp. 65-1402]
MSVLIEPDDLQAAMANEPMVIIDTRDPAAYARGHLPGAVNLREIFTHLATSDPQGLEVLKGKFAEMFGSAGLSGKETAVLYEDAMDSGFGQSCRGYFILNYLGYPKIKVLHGGYQAWQAAGLPTSTETVAPTPAAFPLGGSADVMVDADEVLAAMDAGGVTLLDVRDVDEWIGASSSPYGRDFSPRKGRIPGARWIEWYRMMKPGAAGPVFKAKEEVLAECLTAGITPETPVILYCFKGARASNTFLIFKEAGVKNVKIYFGSWNEWSQDPELPIEEGFPRAC